MRVGEIHDMNEVAHAGAVRRVVVGAENPEDRTPPQRSLDRQRNGMSLRAVPLADAPFGICACGVEVTQHDRAKPLESVQLVKDALDDQLTLSVRVDRPLLMRLDQGDSIRKTIGGAGRGEHKRGYAGS